VTVEVEKRPALEVLKEAREYLGADNWTSGIHGISSDGEVTKTCILGGLYRALTGTLPLRNYELLETLARLDGDAVETLFKFIPQTYRSMYGGEKAWLNDKMTAIYTWNDSKKSPRLILAALDKAIASLES